MAREFRQPSQRIPYLQLNSGRAIELGAVGLQPRVTLYLERTIGRFIPIDFVVDSGASISFVGLDAAQCWGIDLPPPQVETTLHLGTAGGSQAVRVRPGRIRVWWHRDQIGYPFDWPVLFRPGLPLNVPPLLGLGGVVSTCEWRFTGRYDPSSPFGAIRFDDLR